MAFRIIREDITRAKADAIVNTANPHPVIGGGTDTAIYEAAGKDQLLNARKVIGDIEPGEAIDSDIYISESDFKLYADNVVCDSIWLLDENDVNQNIGPDRQAIMHYTYQVPETAKDLEFEYEGTFGFGSFKDITYKVTIE